MNPLQTTGTATPRAGSVPALRFGLVGLPPSEVGLVRTLFKLYAFGAADFRWEVADAAPFDAVLVDSAAPPLGGALLPRIMDAVLVLGRVTGEEANAANTVPSALARPLRSEKLEAWLLDTSRRQVVTPTATGAAPLVDVATSQFKLLRWPPAGLLRNDAQLIRLATLLSRRFVTALDLASMSNQPVEKCRSFMDQLQASSLLSVQSSSVVAHAAAGYAQPQQAVQIANRQKRGLIGRIRLRLGL